MSREGHIRASPHQGGDERFIIRLTRRCAVLLGQRFDPVEARNLRRNFTGVVRSFTGGPSSNQMEDANTNGAVSSPFLTPCAVQPDRGRLRLSTRFGKPTKAGFEYD